jgi:ribosomal-protein-alanine N-acetyltransferase
VLRLNIRCFRNGDNYTKHTFAYLLNEPKTLSYRMITTQGEIVGFVFVMVNDNNAAHLTTIGVAPEHRRRRIAVRLLKHVERSLTQKEIGTLMLEVRVSNTGAQDLYRRLGYWTVQRIAKYYSNGEDCFLMMKALI